MNSNDLEARFEQIESLFKTENAETRRRVQSEAVETCRHFDVVAEGLHDQIKLIAEGHSALTESISELKGGFGRLEAGQSRLELHQPALESQQAKLESGQGQLERIQKVTLSEIRLLASKVERSNSHPPRR